MKTEMAEQHEDKDGFLKRSDMTLRDYFAGQALAGDFANSSFGYFESDVEKTFLVKRAEFYFRVADAMMEARK